MSRSKTVELYDVTSIKESRLAIYVEYDGETYWIPKSQIHDDSEVYTNDQEGTLVIPEWLAIEKEMV